MGMAASQARYLQLSARMSNCEYEGQQINQQRTILANESANLFNQMLVMEVPTVPSSTDYTTVQYTFSDGSYDQTIDNYYQIGTPDSDYNYVVTHSYSVDRYTGSMKHLSDPQVQFSSLESILPPAAYEAYQQGIYQSYAVYESKLAEYEQMEEDANALIKDVESAQVGLLNKVGKTTETALDYDAISGIYKVTDNTGAQYDLSPTDSNTDIEALIKSGVLSKDDQYYSYQDSTGTTHYLSQSSMDKYSTGAATNLTGYSIDMTDPDTLQAITDYDTAVQSYNDAKSAAKNFYDTDVTSAYNDYETLLNTYEESTRPTYIGNCELTEIPVGQMTEDQLAELQQVIYDLGQENIDSNLTGCFDANGDYKGGIFSFELYGTTYYTTYADLYASYTSVDDSDSNNGIDRQYSLPYYSASYVKTKVETTEKALLETDSSGRFTSIRLENDSVKYTLNAETVTDETAYNDAMNQYYYDTAVYEKTVSDINAKTSIIQQQDRTLELRLEQLDTERNTLSTEMEAVQKVLSDNIERTYKTFGD